MLFLLGIPSVVPCYAQLFERRELITGLQSEQKESNVASTRGDNRPATSLNLGHGSSMCKAYYSVVIVLVARGLAIAHEGIQPITYHVTTEERDQSPIPHQ